MRGADGDEGAVRIKVEVVISRLDMETLRYGDPACFEDSCGLIVQLQQAVQAQKFEVVEE